MFQSEQQAIEDKIKNFASAQSLALATLEWKPIPFSGEWGISTSFFASAALESRAGKKVVVPQRAQEMAMQVREALVNTAGLSRIEAVKTNGRYGVLGSDPKSSLERARKFQASTLSRIGRLCVATHNGLYAQ